jgi:hypothetical protein
VKILEKIDSIELADAEKDRIDKCLLDHQSLQFRVLTTKAPSIRDYDFWRRAQRQFRVTGFRDGHPNAIQLVLTRALEAKKSHGSRGTHEAWPLVWPLYLRSVHLYLHDEMPDLHRLLKTEDFQTSPGTLTEQILRSVVKCLPLYEATIDQVRELYELWGFERTNYADEILSSAPVEADAVRRIVENGVSAMRREIASAITSTRADLLRHIEQQGSDVSSLKGLLQKTINDLEDVSAKMCAQNVASEVGRKASEQTAVGQDRSAISVDDAVKRRAGDHLLAAVEALQTRVENFGRQVKDLRTRIDLVEVPRIPAVSGTSVKKHSTTSTALQTIQKWNQVFEEVGVPSRSIGASWILLEVVRRSRVILTDKPQLLLDLISALPEAESCSIVASPLWISESDWKDGLSFVSTDIGVPRLLVIQDFDVALQEAYLVPGLIAWASKLGPQCANRVVLVPSDSELAAVSSRIFEIATLATHSVPYIRDLKRLGETLSDPPPTLELPQSSASILAYARSRNVSSEDDLRQYAANYGVSLPPRVLENFVSLNDGLRASLGRRDAGFVAEQATLLPWIENACGEARSRTVQEALRRLDGD